MKDGGGGLHTKSNLLTTKYIKKGVWIGYIIYFKLIFFDNIDSKSFKKLTVFDIKHPMKA